MSTGDGKGQMSVEEQKTMEYRLAASCISSTYIRKARSALRRLGEASSSREWKFVQDELPSMRTADYLLEHHPGWIPRRLIEEDDSKNGEEIDSKEPAVVSRKEAPPSKKKDGQWDIMLPACFRCGGPLQPGYQATTIRLVSGHNLGTSRTRRRRDSRNRGRLRRERKRLEKQVRGGKRSSPGISNGVGEQRQAMATAVAPLEAYVHSFKDDLASASTFEHLYMQNEFLGCRNYVDLRCACGEKTKIPGYPQKPASSSKQIKQKKQQSASAVSGELDPKRDFVSVSKEAGGGAKKKAKREGRATVSATDKKLNQKSKNELMDWLSSLNDR